MTDNLATRRLIQVGALFLIGDGIMGVINPQRRSLLWHAGPQLVKAVTEEIGDNPKTARTINAGKIALGLALLHCAAEANSGSSRN